MNTRLVRLLDANIILRFLRHDDSVLFDRAKALFTEAESGKFHYYLDEVTVAEVVWVLTSVYKTQRSDIAQKLETMIAQDWIINARKNTILRAFAFYRMCTLNYVDCWLLAVSDEKHIALETFDMKLAKRKKEERRV